MATPPLLPALPPIPVFTDCTATSLKQEGNSLVFQSYSFWHWTTPPPRAKDHVSSRNGVKRPRGAWHPGLGMGTVSSPFRQTKIRI